jgi:hypothetical protein
MATIVADGLELCVDCVMLTANGELGQGDADADEAHDERMTLWLAQYGGRHEPSAGLRRGLRRLVLVASV